MHQDTLMSDHFSVTELQYLHNSASAFEGWLVQLQC